MKVRKSSEKESKRREVRERAEKALSHQKSLGEEEKERALEELRRKLEIEKAEALEKKREDYERIIRKIKDNRRHGQVKRLQDATNLPSQESVFRYKKDSVNTGTQPGKRQETVPTQPKRKNAPLSSLQPKQQRQLPLQQHSIPSLLQPQTEQQQRQPPILHQTTQPQPATQDKSTDEMDIEGLEDFLTISDDAPQNN
jgi:hypothetical protein